MVHRLVLVVVVCAVVAVTGCSRKAKPAASPQPAPFEAPAPEPPAPPAPPSMATPPSPALSEDDIFARKTLDELNAERPLADVPFDYDAWTIRADARTVLQRNAEWLRRWSSTRVTIEGHCDERGTSEYNLALGERRAHAIREYLASLGITSERLLSVSKGEESPLCSETSEQCWQQNRRGRFVITAK